MRMQEDKPGLPRAGPTKPQGRPLAALWAEDAPMAPSGSEPFIAHQEESALTLVACLSQPNGRIGQGNRRPIVRCCLHLFAGQHNVSPRVTSQGVLWDQPPAFICRLEQGSRHLL